jgi:ribosomal protein S18 acetylase RimI-like enzyme
MKIKVFKRPGNKKKLVNELIEIIKSLTGKWFTKEVQEYTPNDLKYQDLITVSNKNELIGFIIYTCIDGKIVIMLMAIKPTYQNMGYGKQLYEAFESKIKNEGFKTIMVQTVPEEVNENYKGTIEFYKKRGFKIVKQYKELWEHGAIELEKGI